MTREERELLGLEPEDKPVIGRPTKYRKELNNIAYEYALLGYTDEETAAAMGIVVSTLNEWKKEYPDFSTSINDGKDIADAKVSRKLLERATGYTGPDIDIRVVDGEIIQTEIFKHYPPDPTSMIFWLKNRQRKSKRWVDKLETGVTDSDGNDVPIVIFKLPDNERRQQAGTDESDRTAAGVST